MVGRFVTSVTKVQQRMAKMYNINMQLNDKIIPAGKVLIEIRDAKTGKLKSQDLVKNTFVTVGKNSIADALRGTIGSNKGIITWCAVGTNATAPDVADTTLGTELFRKLVSVRSVAANVATFQTYFTTAEANGSLREAGLFGDDASVTPNSGTLFSMLAINRTKSSSDTLTLTWSITIG